VSPNKTVGAHYTFLRISRFFLVERERERNKKRKRKTKNRKIKREERDESSYRVYANEFMNGKYTN